MKKKQNSPTRRTVLLAALGGGLSLVAQGCGGGSVQSGEGTGRATFSVTWPQATRLIPEASTSIKIQVLDKEKVVKTVVITSPATKVTIEDLPAKKLVNLVQAFPNADGSGVAQAEARGEIEIKADETVKVALTMQSAIDRLDPSPTGTLTVELNGTATLSVTPRNAAGEVVLIKADTLRWTSSAPTIVSVDNFGVIRCIGSGEVTITCTEPESGKSVTFTIVSGVIGRLVYSQIAGNIRGDFFAQNGPGTFSQFDDEDLPPITSYDFFGKVPPPAAEVNTRECSIFLSSSLPIGTRVAVLGGAVGNPIAELTLAEIENEYDAQGNLVRYHERAFQGFSGHVTLVKIEGTTHTVRVENVKLRAYDRSYRGDEDTPSVVEGQGTFVVNGTLTFKSQ